jgi:hypothetical protein
LRKALTLAVLLFCLGWLVSDRTNVAQAYDCTECVDERAACRLGCDGNQSCLQDCNIMFNHCMLFCDG